jgi:hypothetical protein
VGTNRIKAHERIPSLVVQMKGKTFNSLILPLNQLKKGKGGKWALERLEVDKFPKTREEGSLKMDKMSKEFLTFLDTF